MINIRPVKQIRDNAVAIGGSGGHVAPERRRIVGEIEDPAGRGMLANVLNSECEPLETEHVRAALDTLRHRHLERRQRELRATIADAERKGDSASVIKLTAEKLAVDRELREF